jgi:chromosome segregation ATPase
MFSASLLKQLGDGLVTTRKLVGEIHAGIQGYTGDCQTPVSHLKQEHQSLPQLVASVEKALHDVTALASQTHTNLDTLQHELQNLGSQLSQTSQTRIHALESAGQAVHQQLVEFTGKVQAALEDAQNRGNHLQAAAKATAQSCHDESSQQGAAHKIAQACLSDSGGVVQSTYQPVHFEQFSAAAKALATRLQTLARETLPVQAGKLSTHLSDTHTPGVQTSLSSGARQIGQAHTTFQQHGLETAHALKAAIEHEMTTALNLTAKELPDQIATAATKADKSAQSLSKESDTTKRTAANTSTHLKDQQDRYFEAVQALHTELQRMLGGKK